MTPADKFKILGLLPPGVSSYASQVRQFYSKRDVEKQLREESKPVLLNTDVIDEKGAVGELKETTRKYKHLGKEGFKEDRAKQDEIFNEKIAVSKKIRGIKEKEEKKRTERIQNIKDSTLDRLMMQ